MTKFDQLRHQHPVLEYISYHWQLKDNTLHLKWQFLLYPNLKFNPKTTIEFPKEYSLNKENLDNLVFHLGLIELLSYWKTACPPQILIHPHTLSSEQENWWFDLLQKGLGEFFYTNQINPTQKNLVDFTYSPDATKLELTSQPDTQEKLVLVPIGGGKDSTVTLSTLNSTDYKIVPFLVNPIQAALDTISVSKIETTPVSISRKIDPLLLRLNQSQYLNGHTPFSAYLAFASTLVAELIGAEYIALSNEESANECNVIYHDLEINHQYSKTFEFEEKFQEYSHNHLNAASKYFSFLRPLKEIQIAALFSQHSEFFEVFLSCNRGSKQNIWCHDCPKCLFAFLMLFPFVDYIQLTTKIFNHDILETKSLIDEGIDLIKPDNTKPFECVGSYDETQAAASFAFWWYQTNNKPVPIVLQEMEKTGLISSDPGLIAPLLGYWNSRNALPEEFKQLLQQQTSVLKFNQNR